MPTTRDWVLIALLLVFAALAIVGTMDAQDAENSHRVYCEMVAQWDADAAQDVAPEQRRGWPPFDGRKQCKN
jgi:hypothetical protein